MGDDMENENHALAPFLQERLPPLGLDFETYGPYVLALLDDADAVEGIIAGEDDEEWTGVLELLQASSETHSDDPDVWTQLTTDIRSQWESHCNQAMAEQAKLLAEQEDERARILERERTIAEEAARLELERKEEQALQSAAPDEARQALMARFGYDIPDDDNNNEGGGDSSSGKKGNAASNKEAAAQANLDKTRDLKAQKTTSKREEQQKTKEAKNAKVKAKEDRRARTSKGERRR